LTFVYLIYPLLEEREMEKILAMIEIINKTLLVNIIKAQ